MQIDQKGYGAVTAVDEGDKPGMPWHRRHAGLLAALLATAAMLVLWTAWPHLPDGDTDRSHYLAIAQGQPEMKPFAFRFLAPKLVRAFAHLTGATVEHGFLLLGLVSIWILFYGVLSLVLRRRHGIWFACVLALVPFWLRTFIDYQLPDLPHAALCMVYLLLLRRRWWGGAAVVLAIMYLTRESTLLLAIIAVPVLWRLAGRRAGVMQLAAGLVGMAGSKFGARHALPNHQNMNDTLYMIGKIPWNVSRNIFGVTLWSNTLPLFAPVRVWNVPSWIHAGGIHQVGYGGYLYGYQIFTLTSILSSFGIGFCVLLCLCWRTPIRNLLPRDQPYLCIAAIYGAAAYFLAPMLGAAQARLLDYGWPLFLVYLPAVTVVAWRNAPRGAVYALVALNFIDAWTGLSVHHLGLPYTYGAAVVIVCNLIAAWLLLKTKSAVPDAIAFE